MSSNNLKTGDGDVAQAPDSDQGPVTAAVKPARFIGKREVLDRVGVSYTTIWTMMVAGTFPRSRKLGGKAAWLESEIDEWMKNLPVRRLKGDQ